MLQSEPGAYNAQVLSADCHMQLGQFDKAIAILTPLAPAHVDDAAFNYLLGMSLLQNKQANEAPSTWTGSSSRATRRRRGC